MNFRIVKTLANLELPQQALSPLVIAHDSADLAVHRDCRISARQEHSDRVRVFAEDRIDRREKSMRRGRGCRFGEMRGTEEDQLETAPFKKGKGRGGKEKQNNEGEQVLLE